MRHSNPHRNGNPFKPYRLLNNRKTTLGRPIRHVAFEKLLGYTVRVLHGYLGYRNHESVAIFFSAENDKKQFSRKSYDEAEMKCIELEKQTKAKFHIITRIKRTSKILLQG